MPIHRLSACRLREPKVWSIGMGSIAVVMLLITSSQSSSIATNASHVAGSNQVYAISNGELPGTVYQVVRDGVVEQPGGIAIERTQQFGRTEPYVGSDRVEDNDEKKRRFIQLVRQAKLAKLIDDNELSASLVIEAQALLFGSANPESLE